jgi:hypothetical protein
MSPVTAGIYGGGPLYDDGPVIDELRASGMTMVVAWSVHVSETGDLIFNDPKIVSGGEYVGDPGWPDRMATLKEPPTSVTRLIFSVGAGGVDDFHHIQSLIQEQGTGPDSILHRNFAALRAAIPVIDAIDFDDEDLMDADTTVEFALMLGELGYEVTFCPYYRPDYWAGCLKRVDAAAPGLVTAFNLQCYAGGAYNDPKDWIDAVQKTMGPDFDAKGFVLPGLWCANGAGCSEGHCPDSVKSRLADWRTAAGIQGGWIWLLDDVLKCQDSEACSGSMGISAYAGAIESALG